MATKTKKTTSLSIERIIRLALTNMYHGINDDALIEVIAATPNAELATEILLGVWEAPLIRPFSANTHSNGIGPLRFKEYDKWTGKVKYEYDAKDITVRWYKTQEEADKSDLKTYGENYSYYQKEGFQYKRVWDNGIKNEKAECDLNKWLENQFEEYHVLEDVPEKTGVEAVI
jgi:hypothetical protein